MGDPQAPFVRVLEILDAHALLGEDGRLLPGVALVSMGDHFDWGTREERAQAAFDGLHLLAWLSAHPADQVTILAGNHDLARVSELAAWDDDGFGRAQQEADRAYDETGAALDAGFHARWPHAPSVESVARDLATFRVVQRDLVAHLLRVGRMRAAVARDGILLVHAGATTDDIHAAGGDPRGDAAHAAQTLCDAFDAAFLALEPGQPLHVVGLHQPAGLLTEGRGVLYQRPANPALEPEAAFVGPPRRRFDPRTLPLLTQVVGHVRDGKCVELLGGWTEPRPPAHGRLRWLETDGTTVRYRLGTPGSRDRGAVLVFTDGGMRVTPPARFELLDLDRMAEAGHA
jgi:hypothetical protein